jgi:hypothetical protein
MRALALAAALLCIGPGLFLTSVEAVAAPPPNDNFANATLLTGNSGSVSVSIADATREPNEPQDQYCSNGTAWYKWVAPAAGELQVLSGGTAEGGFSCAYIFVGSSVGSLSTVPGRYLRVAFSIHTRSIQETVTVVAGQTYYIQTSTRDGFFAPYTTAGFNFSFTQPPLNVVAAVLPNARSVQVGSPATAFATMINTHTTNNVGGCQIVLPQGIPADFQYRAADANNNFTAPVNTPVGIPAGGRQDFVFGVTPTAPLNSLDIPLIFDCIGTAPATSISGLDTFLLSASTTPVPDLMSISATIGNDGIANIPGTTGTGFFTAATINISSTGTVTATVDDNGRNLPLAVALCQTDPSTGACINPATPASSSTFALANNETATFTVFARGAGTIPFDPANNRLFLRFKTSDGVIRGSTSVAVRTQ